MIKKLEQTIRGFDDKPAMPTAIEFFNKINEVVDVVNQLVLCEQSRTCYELIHKNEVPDDPYAEQRKWQNKLCWFWNDDCCDCFGILWRIHDLDKTPFENDLGEKFQHCRPIKPDDNIIYRGE